MRIIVSALLVISSLTPVWIGLPPRFTDPIDTPIDTIIASLTPEERVGQLMLVTFEGSQAGTETEIGQLIQDYNLGGVVLLAENDNIDGYVNVPQLVQSLTISLQQVTYDSAQATHDRLTPRAFIPLFIATTHAGEGLPGTQIAGGTTPLPSQMALGATWNPANVQIVGQIAGSELEAMGINMLLGPALDVAQQPQAGRTLDLGVDTFGGDPAWVGQMGQAYIAGVHEGSQGRIAVIAQHFPGLGLADTQPDQQIPVVPRALDELRMVDLVPYHAVTGGASTPLARADGLQCANVRYLGENARTITRPVCVDEFAAGQLLALDEFAGWREDGLVISSALGTYAIRRYYDTTPFPHRQIAREAFLAGNDLLYLTHFGPTPSENQFANVIDVIRFFAGRYEDDPVFQGRVDESLKRVLRLKLRLYGDNFALENVINAANTLDRVGSGSTALYNIALQSTTLLAPRRASLPPPPARNDDMVIFTDVRLVQQCSYCATYPLVPANALEVAIERIYGPQAGAQIRPEQVVSFSFDQLQAYLQATTADVPMEGDQLRTIQRLSGALLNAEWIVFVMLDISPDIETSTLVRDLLDTETRILENTRVVVIALAAPTYLSSTEISRFAAYYGLYSTIPPYIDAAARALFQESTFVGAPPISVPAVGYDVLAAEPAPFATRVSSPVFSSAESNPSPLSDTRRRLEALDLVLSLFGLVMFSAGSLWIGRALSQTITGGVRVLLGCVVAGLTGYIYYGVGGPGTRDLYGYLGNLAPLLVTLVSGLIGLAVTGWLLRRER